MLSFTIHRAGNTTLFRCAGRLFSGDSECLRDGVLTRSHAPNVVIDLAEVSSLDAGGLSVLLALREWAQMTATKLKLMNLTPRVEEVFELTNLRDVFEFCSVAEMLALMCQLLRQNSHSFALQELSQLSVHARQEPNS